MKELDFYCQRCGEKHEDQHPENADLYNFIKLHYNECGGEGIKIKVQPDDVSKQIEEVDQRVSGFAYKLRHIRVEIKEMKDYMNSLYNSIQAICEELRNK